MENRDDESSCEALSSYDSPMSLFNSRKSSESIISGDTVALSCTPEEDKKLRRRILNRECARSMRQRRMLYVQTLEHKVHELEQENQMLQMKMKLLEMSNQHSTASPSAAAPQRYRTSEILQAIPLQADQVKNAPILAYEVDVRVASEVGTVPPLFSRQWSGSSNSAISSPNSSENASCTFEDGEPASLVRSQSCDDMMDQMFTMMDPVDNKTSHSYPQLIDAGGASAGYAMPDDLLLFGSEAEW